VSVKKSKCEIENLLVENWRGMKDTGSAVIVGRRLGYAIPAGTDNMKTFLIFDPDTRVGIDCRFLIGEGRDFDANCTNFTD
jgi:hypothetical protein